MLHIANFEQEFYGRTFKERLVSMQSDLTCIGYGDNQGNPYFIGMYVNQQTQSVNFRTVLLKNAEFLPKS